MRLSLEKTKFSIQSLWLDSYAPGACPTIASCVASLTRGAGRRNRRSSLVSRTRTRLADELESNHFTVENNGRKAIANSSGKAMPDYGGTSLLRTQVPPRQRATKLAKALRLKAHSFYLFFICNPREKTIHNNIAREHLAGSPFVRVLIWIRFRCCVFVVT